MSLVRSLPTIHQIVAALQVVGFLFALIFAVILTVLAVDWYLRSRQPKGRALARQSRCGAVRLRKARLGSALAVLARRVQAGRGWARHVEAGQGSAWHGSTTHHNSIKEKSPK